MRNYLLNKKILISLSILCSFGGLVLGQTKTGAEPFAIEKVIVGTVDSPSDFTATVTMEWDADSVYMFFNVTDDSIVNAGTQYQVDNIEVYFDMNNSKNVHWPRNGGWVAGDPTFDTVDYQFRLVPDSAFSANNGFVGANQIYTKNDTGYTFQLNIEWNSLMADFSQASNTAQVSGTLIGFDVLISDNDAEASDPNRNQITFNSSTDKAFNDPSLWATLKALITGGFEIIPDEEAPSVPANVAAAVTENDVALTWDAATDNTAVLFYNVSVDGTAEEKAIYAQADGSVTYNLKDLAEGTYNLAVMATDNNGNASDYSTAVEAIIVGINDLVNDLVFDAYPNPVTSILYIKNAATISSVQVIGINGSIMKAQVNNNSEQMLLDVSNLAKGMYILKANTTNGSVVTSKLIKN